MFRDFLRTVSLFLVSMILFMNIVINPSPVQAESEEPTDFIVQGITGEEFALTIPAQDHADYGFTYPATYVFSIPAAATDLLAYRKASQNSVWELIDTKSAGEIYSGVEAARFDYEADKAYISLAFPADSDTQYLKITDQYGYSISASYKEIANFYDNRRVVVIITIDDIGVPPPWGSNEKFLQASQLFAACGVWWTGAITTQGSEIDWSVYQQGVNTGFLEISSHSREHPDNDYPDYDSEIGGSKADIINNLTLPYNRGGQDYLWSWIEPSGYSDDTVSQKLGEYKYLVPRMTSEFTPGNSWEEWDEVNKHFIRVRPTAFLDSVTYDWMKWFFDYVYDTGGVYHGWGHIGPTDWLEGSDHYRFIEYISGRPDVWYTGLGQMYMYRYTGMAVNVTVNDTPVTYTLTVNQTQGGTVTFEPQQDIYQQGDTVTLTAYADNGWKFTGWSGDPGGSANPLTITMNDSLSVSAVFEQTSIPDSGTWWNQGWSKRAEIIIHETSGANLANYQVELRAVYDNDMQHDFSDIRFTDFDNQVALYHWRESYTSSGEAVFWVKVPHIPASGATHIYMYYGNPSAQTASDIHNTFIFGDDFEDVTWTNSNLNKVNFWGSEQYAQDSIYHMLGPTDSEPLAEPYENGALKEFPPNYIAEIEFSPVVLAGGVYLSPRYTETDHKYECWVYTEAPSCALAVKVPGDWFMPVSTPISYPLSEGNWYSLKSAINMEESTNHFKVYFEDQLYVDTYEATLQYADYRGFAFLTYCWDKPFHMAYDDFRIREYAAAEPVCTTGQEQEQEQGINIVRTQSASNIMGTSAALNGQLDSMSEYDSVSVYFEWGLTDEYGYTTPIQILSATGNFSQTIDGLNPGSEYHFRAKAVDPDTAGEDYQFNAWQNSSPVLNPIGNKTVTEGQMLQFVVAASDPDAGDVLLYTASGLPGGAIFDPDTRTFTWDNPVTGAYPGCRFEVTDGLLSDYEDITITVNAVQPVEYTLAVNISGQGTVTRNPNKTVYTNGENVTLTASASTGWTFTGWSGTITGSENPVVITMDGDKTVTATFTSTNDPEKYEIYTVSNAIDIFYGAYMKAQTFVPQITHTVTKVRLAVLKRGNPGGDLVVSIRATDINGRPTGPDLVSGSITCSNITETWSKIWYDIDLGTGCEALAGVKYAIVWRAPNADASKPLYYYLNTADGYGGGWVMGYSGTGVWTDIASKAWDACFEEWGITGTPAPVNHPPVLETIGNKTVTEGQPLQFTISATDPDATDALIYSASGLPGDAEFEAAARTFTWSSPVTGVYTGCRFEVTDGLSTDYEDITITVNPIPAVQRALTINITGAGTTSKNPDQTTYDDGSNVTLTAIPAAGSFFSGWSGDVTGTDNPVTFNIDADKTVTATFTYIEYTLDISVTGNGTVAKNPDKSTYHYGDTVMLTAEPGTGSQFSGWAGGLSGSTNPAIITISGNTSITAAFALTTYSLKLNITGQGTISKSPDKTSYTDGEVVTLTAAPAAGWIFTGWTGAVSGTTNPTTITMNSNKTVTAIFTSTAVLAKYENFTTSNAIDDFYGVNWKGQTFIPQATHTLTKVHLAVIRRGSPMGGVIVSIRATDSNGRPAGPDLANGTIPCLNIAETWSKIWYEFDLGAGCQVQAGVKYVIVWNAPGATASSPLYYWLNTTGGYANGWVVNSGNSGAAWANLVNGVWDANFEEWGITGTPAPVNHPPVLALIGNKTVTADQTLQFTISGSDPDAGDILVYSAPVIPAGSSFDPVTRTFTWLNPIIGTYPGCRFEVTDGLLTDAEEITITVNSEQTNQYSLAIGTTGQGTVNKDPDKTDYNEGEIVTLTAVPAADYTFFGWSGDITGAENPITVTMNSDKTITAVFKQTGTLNKYENYLTGNAIDIFYGSSVKGQTFTPSVTHTLTKVRLQLLRRGTANGDIIINIQAADASGWPTGKILASGSIACSSIAETWSAVWYDIDLGAGCQVQAGVKYAITWSAPGMGAGNPMYYWVNTAGAYAGGWTVGYVSSWYDIAARNWDAVFEEWGQ